jgi:hypothetical protein
MAKDFVGVVQHIDVLHFPYTGFLKSLFNSLRGAHVSGAS